MVKQFKSLADLEKYIQSQLENQVQKDDNIREVVANTMSEAIQDNVYDAYKPKEYKRRGIAGGLADPDNVYITSVNSEGNNVKMEFMNLTTGQDEQLPIYDHMIDSMYNKTIAETIEEGIKSNWYSPNETDEYGRVVSDPRPFTEETVRRLKSNSNELNDAVKRTLKNAGFEIK